MTLDNHHCVQLVPLFEKLAEQDLTKVEKIVEHKKIKKGEINFTFLILIIITH